MCISDLCKITNLCSFKSFAIVALGNSGEGIVVHCYQGTWIASRPHCAETPVSVCVAPNLVFTR